MPATVGVTVSCGAASAGDAPCARPAAGADLAGRAAPFYENAPHTSRGFMIWRECSPHMRDYWQGMDRAMLR